MDPLSQASVGATFAQSLSGERDRTGIAFLAGALSGMAADLDILIRSDSDPLLFLEYHRQFTHSLFFIPFGALICAAILKVFMRGRLSFGRIYLFALLGYSSHGLLDACTSYGTQLFWPFSDSRIAWDIISIVDPLFTLPVLVLVLIATFRNQPVYARVAMIYGLAYMSVGAFQHHRAMQVLEQLAEQRGHDTRKASARPTFANLYLWRLIYESGDQYHSAAVRLGRQRELLEGESVSSLVKANILGTGSVQSVDVERFRWFSSGYIAHNPDNPMIIGDVRYSLVPDRIEPIWGIMLDPANPDKHVRYVVTRDFNQERRLAFLSSLFGEFKTGRILD